MHYPAPLDTPALFKTLLFGLLIFSPLGVRADIASDCTGGCANAKTYLTANMVSQVIAQAFQEASASGQEKVTIAVVDRVGNVLGLFENTQAASEVSGVGGTVVIRSGRFNTRPPKYTPLLGPSGSNQNPPLIPTYSEDPNTQNYSARGQGLEETQVPSSYAAISKAITAAYLSSEGNAFSSYTAAQIIQEHFNPNVIGQAAGPLFGVQFSQLPCGDFVTTSAGVGIGPKSAPLGFSGQRGGLPLYLRGTPVGAIGVIATPNYTIEQNISNPVPSADERIALAGSYGFRAPYNRRADVITVNGQTLRFLSTADDAISTNPLTAPSLSSLITSGKGVLVDVPNYFVASNGVLAGVAFGQLPSGVIPSKIAYSGSQRADPFRGLNAYVLSTSTGLNRYPPIDGAVEEGEQLTQQDVTTLLRKAIGVARESRSQIRRPLSTDARLSVSVVDTQGTILGLLRSQDSPMFSSDVAIQKARSAAFFSRSDAASLLQPTLASPYVARSQQLIPFATKGPLFTDGSALTPRALGNIARPLLPDGIPDTPFAPLSLPYQPVSAYASGINQWSEFNVGLQLDLVISDLLYAATAPFDPISTTAPDGSTTVTPRPPVMNCVQSSPSIPPKALANGMQTFAGGVPLYKNGVLVGAIGESGDGIDQDDMAGFLGAYRTGLVTNPKVSNARALIRSNRITFNDGHATVALRFVECPFRPFINNSTENACNGK